MDLELLTHTLTIGSGFAIGGFGYFHRGDFFIDENGTSISKGNGISSWIINNISESYRYVSAAVDHVSMNLGIILVGGGILDLALHYLANAHPESSPNFSKLVPYVVAASFVASKNLDDYWHRTRQRYIHGELDISDHLQHFVDITAPLATLYLLYRIF